MQNWKMSFCTASDWSYSWRAELEAKRVKVRQESINCFFLISLKLRKFPSSLTWNFFVYLFIVVLYHFIWPGGKMVVKGITTAKKLTKMRCYLSDLLNSIQNAISANQKVPRNSWRPFVFECICAPCCTGWYWNQMFEKFERFEKLNKLRLSLRKLF